VLFNCVHFAKYRVSVPSCDDDPDSNVDAQLGQEHDQEGLDHLLNRRNPFEDGGGELTEDEGT